MFGLMKARICHLDGDQKLRRRLHYCGACKTIGALYGQRSRFLLNNDTVFLGELLSAATAEPDSIYSWPQAYKSYNCLSMPRSEDEMPLPLLIAATATVVLTEFKIKDHVEDSSNRLLKLAAGVYSASFGRAADVLKSWDFPIEQLRSVLESQSGRESSVAVGEGSSKSFEIITYLSEPTAAASALFFEHGMKLVGRADLSQTAYQIGHDFGSMIYLLDAFEDYEKDSKKSEFNAIREAWRLSTSRLDRTDRDRVAKTIWEMADRICDGIGALGLPKESQDIFVSRLRSNLSSRLAVRLPIAQGEIPFHVCRHASSAGLSGLSSRVKQAISTGKTMFAEYRNSRRGFALAVLAAPLVFVSAVLVAFAFPEQSRSATSYRECLGIALNLMFLTGLLRSMAAAPLRWAHIHRSTPPPPESNLHGSGDNPFGQTPPPPGPLPNPPPGPPPGKRKGGGCSCCVCDSDCCDGIECCCDCGDCVGCCDCG